MFVPGVGIGPTLAVFTIVVQNAVPFQQLGVATSNLTFFRQIGGSVGLAIAGTIFGTRLLERDPPGSSRSAGLPQQAVDQFANARDGGDLDNLVGVGDDLGGQILAIVPPAFQDAVRAVPRRASSAGSTRRSAWRSRRPSGSGVVTTVGALIVALAIRELPLRNTIGEGSHAEAPAGSDGRTAAPASRLSGSPSVD